MLLFCYGIDPHLERLAARLQGITLYSSPTLGPVLPNEPPLEPTEEKYKLVGYCDDCKPAVTSMAEFSLVERETRLFEAASGTELHRDRTSNKVKFLPLGRWKGTLTEDDLPNECKYIAFSEHLDMLGPQLFSSFQKTRKVNGEISVDKCRKTSGPWKLRRMPLTQRPWSSNTYLLPSFWYKACL